jgi:hypothetical protein
MEEYLINERFYVDFYLPELNTILEVNGPLHYYII